MSVTNGQDANQTTFNNGFMDKNTDTFTVGVVDLLNTATPASGGVIHNIQRELRKLNSFLGSIVETAFDALPTWTNNQVGASTDSVQLRADNLTERFDGSTGHTHDNTDGNGPQIQAENLGNINLYFADFQTTTFDSAGGTSDDVSTSFSGETPGGGTATVGVATTAPDNRCEIRTKLAGDQIEDGGGQKVYARITESAGVWTLTYYTNEAGTETAHSLATQDIRIYFKEVFDQSTRPTFPSDVGDIGSLDMTADIVDASVTQRGVVSTGTQSLAGNKTFQDDLILGSKLQGSVVTDSSTTGATATLASPDKVLLRVTNASLTGIQNISGPATSQIFTLLNRTGNDINIVNDSGGTAANRIITGTGADMTLAEDASIIFAYDDTTTRWQVVGGSGGGSGVVGYQEIPTGTVNGSNTTFGPLTFVPANDDSILVMLDGVAVDSSLWSVSANSIVFTTAPVTDQQVYVFYLTTGNPSSPSVTGTFKVEYRTITSGENTAEQLTLALTPFTPTELMLDIIGGGAQENGVDFIVTGNVLDWNTYGLDGVLTTGDKLRIAYIT